MNYIEERSSVICFSHDLALMTTRQWLLEKLDCSVSPVMTMANFREKLRTDSVEIAILCQSLNPEECRDADHFAEESRPDVRLLLFLSAHQEYIPKRECVLLDANCGPLIFLLTVQDLLKPANGVAAVVH